MIRLIPQQRILAAINHKPLDRFPLDIGGPVSSISKIAYDRFLKTYDSSLFPSEVCDKSQQLACLHEKFLNKWKVDTRHIRPPFKLKSVSKNSYVDSFGIKRIRVSSPQYPTLYYEMVDYPLKNSTNVDDILDFNWPSFDRQRLDEIRSIARHYYDQGFAVITDPPAGGILEKPIALCGMEKFFRAIYGNYEFVKTLLEYSSMFHCHFWEEWLDELADWVTIAFIGDDYGTQERMMISPKMWRELVKPHLKDLVKTIKNAANVKVMLHSCGSIAPIIPDLIEVGIDVLNPVQPAKGMDHQKIKASFGDKLCFHGGIDTQEVLPRGSPTNVRQEVQRVFNTLGHDGTGYIFAPAHNILADVFPENISALFGWVTK